MSAVMEDPGLNEGPGVSHDATRGRAADKIVIAGTGRAGTTLLVRFLSAVGLDTGFTADSPIFEESRAGLEQRYYDGALPRVIKNPELSTQLRGLLGEGRLSVEHVIIPIRTLSEAAASRTRASNLGLSIGVPGGMWGSNNPRRQEDTLARILYELIDTCAEYELPFTLLSFPRFVSDRDYLHRQLGFLAPNVTRSEWDSAMDAVAKPELVHATPLSSSERVASYVLTPIGIAKRAARKQAGLVKKSVMRQASSAHRTGN